MEFDQCFFDEGIWRLDSRDQIEEDDGAYWPTPLTAWIEENFCSRHNCPYCGTLLKEGLYNSEIESELSEGAMVEAPDIAQLWACPYCTYWQWYSIFENRGLHGDAAMSVLKKFEPLVPEGCWIELAQHLRRNHDLWCYLDPIGMERLVTQLFRANFSHVEVKHIGRPGDRGVDILFIDSGGATWLIQVKRRSAAGAVEGFETLQRLLGTLALEGEQRGIIVSNASHFSVQAKRQAVRAAHRGMTIELLDKGMLNRMLGALLPERPWRSLLKKLAVPIELEERFNRMVSGPGAHNPRPQADGLRRR